MPFGGSGAQQETGILIFGNGSDGNVTINSDIILSRDMKYNNLTIEAGKKLLTNGYRVMVKGILTNNGTIQNNGQNASSEGLGGATGSLAGGGRGGYDTTTNRFGRSVNPGYGGNGNGYNNSGGVVTAPALGLSPFVSPIVAQLFWSGSGRIGGGGGGGHDGASQPGGGGGGVVCIFASTLINNGTISATGGNATNNGGGGGGGCIFLGYKSKPAAGTVTVAGGSSNYSGSAGNIFEYIYS